MVDLETVVKGLVMSLVLFPSAASAAAITIQNFAFSPNTLNITVGDSVTWTNKDGTAHTSTSDEGLWDSGSLSLSQTYTKTFATEGSFGYHCRPHPWMTGTVNVASTTSTTTSTSSSTTSTTSSTTLSTHSAGNVVLNELMPNPSGGGSVGEWIELYNNDTLGVNVSGWRIGGGGVNYTLPSAVISQGAFAVYYGNETNISLNDSADSVHLYGVNGTLLDNVSYVSAAVNESVRRSADGDGVWTTSNSTSPATPGSSNNGLSTLNVSFVAGWNLISLPLNL